MTDEEWENWLGSNALSVTLEGEADGALASGPLEWTTEALVTAFQYVATSGIREMTWSLTIDGPRVRREVEAELEHENGDSVANAVAN